MGIPEKTVNIIELDSLCPHLHPWRLGTCVVCLDHCCFLFFLLSVPLYLDMNHSYEVKDES